MAAAECLKYLGFQIQFSFKLKRNGMSETLFHFRVLVTITIQKKLFGLHSLGDPSFCCSSRKFLSFFLIN